MFDGSGFFVGDGCVLVGVVVGSEVDEDVVLLEVGFDEELDDDGLYLVSR